MKGKASINLPQFFEIGAGKVDKLFAILKSYNLTCKKVLLLGDDKTFELGANKIAGQFKEKSTALFKEKVYDSNEHEVRRIKSIIAKRRPELVIGFGGGKVLDVAKLSAGQSHLRYISVPTILSNDGIASPVSVIKDGKGIPISHLTAAPYGVVVDIDIIKKAPIRHLRAGVGDLISNLSAVFDARLGQKRGYERINPSILKLAESGALRFLKLKSYSLRSNKFLTTLAEGLIKSGLAMCICGSSRPASGSEHKISHAIDYLYSPRKTLHGEQAGIATLFTMAIQKNKYLTQIKRLYSKIAFPEKLKDLSLTPDKFVRVIAKAKRFRPERYTILDELVLNQKKIKKIIKCLKL